MVLKHEPVQLEHELTVVFLVVVADVALNPLEVKGVVEGGAGDFCFVNCCIVDFDADFVAELGDGGLDFVRSFVHRELSPVNDFRTFDVPSCKFFVLF